MDGILWVKGLQTNTLEAVADGTAEGGVGGVLQKLVDGVVVATLIPRHPSNNRASKDSTPE